jgi:HlyD family secretion protein
MRAALIVLVLAAALAAGIYWTTQPQPIAVQVQAVETGRVARTVSNTRAGTVKACRRSYLAPAVPGQISHLPVHEGQRVETGALLLSVWNEDLKAKLELARSEVRSTQASEGEVCLRAEEAVREARRLVGLRQRNLVSEEVSDRAQTEEKALAASCRAAKAATQVSRSQILVAQTALVQTELRAPFNGIVAEVNGELGEYITPSPPGIPTLPAVDLIDDSCMLVSAPIDEVDAPGIEPGQPVCVSLDAYPERICTGKVRRIAPYVLDREKQARTVEVEVDFTRPQEITKLLVGYSADVEIEQEARENVLRIPSEAVLEGYRVYVYQADTGTLEERGFEAGLSNWEYTEVKSGLQKGERVVTSIAREGVEDGALANVD